MFGRLLGWYTIYTFSGALAPKGILPGAKFTLRQSLIALSYTGSVTALHSGREPNCGVVQGTELRNFYRGRHATYIRQGGHHIGHRPTF